MAKTIHTIRVISGTHRSRRLPVLNYDGLRPTGDRVRETLFNWLQSHIAGRNILDLCAGSGALGFEAASRGAKSVSLVEINHAISKQLSQIVEEFKFDNVKVFNQTAQQFSSQCNEPFDIVFIDPPFSENLMQKLSELALPLVNARGFLYREVAIDTELKHLGDNWELYRQKTFGKVKIELWQKNS